MEKKKIRGKSFYKGHIPWNKGLKGVGGWLKGKPRGIVTSGAFKKGHKESGETKRKRSLALRRVQRTPEWRENIRKALTGKRYSEERRRNISNALKGRKLSLEACLKISEARKGEKAYQWKGGLPKCKTCNKKLTNYKSKRCRKHAGLKGENNWNWKGDNVTYEAIHIWLKTNFGKASSCVNSSCKGKSDKYEWASISHSCKRDINDYMQLCVSCHRSYDYKQNLREMKPLL